MWALGLGFRVGHCWLAPITVCALACSNGGGDDDASAGAGAGAGVAGQAATGGSGAMAGAGSGGSSGSSSGTSGTLEEIASPGPVTNLVVKDGYVYYADLDYDAGTNTRGHLSKVPVGGGAPMELARSVADDVTGLGVLMVAGIVVDATSVYYVDEGTARLLKTPIGGGDTVELWSDADCQIWYPLALDGDKLYWFKRCGNSLNGGLMTVPTAGGAPATLGSGTESDWTPGVYGVNENNRSLSVGGGFAYWTNLSGAVLSLPVTGGDAPTQITNLTDEPTAIVLADNLLYVLVVPRGTLGTGLVLSLPTTPPPFSTVIADDQGIVVPNAFALDDTSAYWATADAILSAPKGGGDIVTLAASLSEPASLAVDATHVYFTQKAGGVWRIPKK